VTVYFGTAVRKRSMRKIEFRLAMRRAKAAGADGSGPVLTQDLKPSISSHNAPY
jgi:hypothetical protein